MSSLDQFASVFNAAAKPAYQHADIKINKVLVITDLEEAQAKLYQQSIRNFLSVVDRGAGANWHTVPGKDFTTVHNLIQLVEKERPDFIATYRHLHSEAWRWPYSLGEHLDVLIQATDSPVLVLPHPDRKGIPEHALEDTTHVMAVTGHLAGDDQLVHYAVRFTQENKTLILAHVEDEMVFSRYMDSISKIPEIDTDVARGTIMEQLLREPSEYISSCMEVLRKERIKISIESSVTIGHRLDHFQKLLKEHQVDLMVMNSKDEDQLAMHGKAHPLAVELRSTPLLFL